jgi:hypothetical protein
MIMKILPAWLISLCSKDTSSAGCLGVDGHGGGPPSHGRGASPQVLRQSSQEMR